MSGDLVTRDELKAMVEVQSKNVEQLTVIANHLSTIVDRENKIYERLYNGLAKDIASSIAGPMNELRDAVLSAKDKQNSQCAAASPLLSSAFNAVLDNSSIAKDIGHVKWFIGIVGVVIVVASVILNGIGRKNETYDILHTLKNEFIHAAEQSPDLKEHLAQTKEVIK